MQVVTSSSANLSHTAQGHYGIQLTHEQVVVDGVAHTAGPAASLPQVDQWLATSAGLMRVVGPSTHDWTALFSRVSRVDPDVLAVVSSGRLAPSYAEAHTAAVALRSDPAPAPRAGARAQLTVVDTMTADVATALLAMVAAEGGRARAPIAQVVHTVEVLARRALFAWWAPRMHTMAGVRLASAAPDGETRPIFGLAAGEVEVVGRAPAKGAPASALAEHAVRVAGGARKLWVGIAHGGAPVEAMQLEEELRRRLPIDYVYRRALAPTSYAYLGAGALALAVLAMDGLPWAPVTPPDFSETRRPVRRARSLTPS